SGGPPPEAALGPGAFAVFTRWTSGTGFLGAFVPPPVPRPVYVPAPVIAPPPVIVHEYRPVYVQPPVYYAPPVYRVYHAPARTVVIEKRVVVPPGHGWKRHHGHDRDR